MKKHIAVHPSSVKGYTHEETNWNFATVKGATAHALAILPTGFEIDVHMPDCGTVAAPKNECVIPYCTCEPHSTSPMPDVSV